MDASYMLRHYLAALKYRFHHAIAHAKENYPTYVVGGGARTPLEIVSHISQVLRYAQSVFYHDVKLHAALKTWEEEVEQFYHEVNLLDQCISEGISDQDRIIEKLLQGPLSDAMTHVGQLAMLRRLSGDPIPGESFFDADISI